MRGGIGPLGLPVPLGAQPCDFSPGYRERGFSIDESQVLQLPVLAGPS